MSTRRPPIPLAAPIPAAAPVNPNATVHPYAPIPATLQLSSGRHWQQVLAPDPGADGQFFDAVKSTRVYCRPTCPSRRPALRNVTFFPTAAAAEQAGYRACKRCQPALAAPHPDPSAAIVAAATQHLARHAPEPVRISELARLAGVSRLTLLRGFRRVLGVSPSQFARAQRVARFQNALSPASAPSRLPAARTRTLPALASKRITDAIYDAGFGSSSRLYESSSQSLGMTPRAMRAGGAGLTIRYATASTSLGRMIVAATPAGVCAIAFGNHDAELVAGLQQRFPAARLTPGQASSGLLADAVAFIASQTTEHPLALDFPLDVRATAFQQRVWKALQQIPRGHTRSYSQLAASLGRPTAARAVASACAANPVAVAIPCHRVIGRDGSLTGYRWGVERKRRLLAAESPQP